MDATAVETVDAITPEWTTAVLEQNGVRATVRCVRTEPVGTGQMGSCHRLFIDYAAGEKGIVDQYHQRLVELGVDGYSAERCWEDYRYGLFQGPFITVLGAFVAQPTARGDEMFTVMAERSAAAITDLNAMSLL